MATYLELCEELHTEAGIAGNPPSSVTGQLGDNKRIVHNIKKAWQEIQLKRNDWHFLAEEFSILVPAGTRIINKALLVAASVANADRFREFKQTEMTSYPISIGQGGETCIEYVPYDYFRKSFLTGVQVAASPEYFSLNTKGEMVLDNTPVEDIQVRGIFYKTPQVLNLGTDVPEMPAHFHNLITYEALVRYGYFEAASESIEFAERQLKKLMNQLLVEQTPDVHFGR